MTTNEVYAPPKSNTSIESDSEFTHQREAIRKRLTQLNISFLVGIAMMILLFVIIGMSGDAITDKSNPVRQLWFVGYFAWLGCGLTFLYFLGSLARLLDKSAVLWVLVAIVFFPFGTLVGHLVMRNSAKNV